MRVCIVTLARSLKIFFPGASMGDFALVFLFVCMLIVPCYLATRNLRGQPSVRVKGAAVLAVAESDEDGESSALIEAFVDRRALAIQRSREIYFRTGGGVPAPDYRPLTAQDRKLGSPSRDRRAG